MTIPIEIAWGIMIALGGFVFGTLWGITVQFSAG